MNQFIAVVLLLFPFLALSQGSDYVITKEDTTLYGTIEPLNLSLNASRIRFQDEQGNSTVYTPSDLLEWSKDGLVYQPKLYPFKRKKDVLTFMQLILEDSLNINVYE